MAALPGAGFSAVPLRVSLDGVANDGSNCPGAACNGDNVLPDFETLLGSDNGDEVLVGNKAPQGMIGNGGNDVLKGGGGADALTCNTGSVIGGGGGDRFVVYPGCVTVRGGKATDLVRFGLPNQEVIVTLDDVANDGPPGADINIRSDVEDLFGGTGGDTLVGSKGANVLDGGFGPDTLLGRGGNDILVGGGGINFLDGGGGTDQCNLGEGGTQVNCE